ncbi:MAG: S-adenosylmethionine decarboxylase [Gammaproteobacteria bacterium]|jgi:S-adenosylmethionine/arginine decarboxylase-like enzyme|nr:S-adenosylmethionine decarboxylase [Gammaproteobacteria bacterium]|tara:strand:- start:22 stop:411 length:390 start_codon:yes stop_codon:yes gene_type:complete
MNVEHKHLLVRAEVDNCPMKNELGYVLTWMNDLISKINMKLMHGPNISYIDQVGNRGITCMALIETSHIVLHIWDEAKPGLFQLDVYSCKSFDLNIVIESLRKSFSVRKIQYKFLDRKSDLLLVEEKKL